ncbi:MAG: DNA mismatch repair endonuclease MutL [Acidobacteria bacterium]|nr:DNA mismatch repair endonuclease MutL [Acidobacteriota bacterium]
MARIRVLPASIINKIAAGEIVERPASVVKELLENSLDAGAGRIEITVDGGGKTLMSVRDDGEGMTRDDALLAFEHHATSKIRTADDLASVCSLGFRGEALPSIAAVSRLSLRTVARSSSEGAVHVGTLVEIHGGVVREVKDIAWAEGTEITVRQLFYNTPARKKFLRAESTESAHIVRLVMHYAFANPAVAFCLTNNGRRSIDAPPVKALSERIHQLFGEQFLERMIPLDKSWEGVRVWGMISRPEQRRSGTDAQYYFVNGRMVRDRLLTATLSKVYRDILPVGTYPTAILFLEIPPEEIDVNVHPAKTEIRFRQPWPVQNFFRSVIQETLQGHRAFAAYRFPAEPASAASADDTVDPAESYRSRVAQRLDSIYETSGKSFLQAAAGHPRLNFPLPESRFSTPAEVEPAMGGEVQGGGAAAAGPVTEPTIWTVLGQWRDSYIVAATPDELMIIDQHVAHERVLYEDYLRQMAAGDVPRQKLLVPLQLELTSEQLLLFDRLQERFIANGFEMEPFGARSLLVKAIPALASHCEVEQLVFEILERIEDEGDNFAVADIQERVAAGLACRAAVKINTPLHAEKMDFLVHRLLATENPMSCPHGRPVVLRIHIRDLEKNFLRV